MNFRHVGPWHMFTSFNDIFPLTFGILRAWSRFTSLSVLFLINLPRLRPSRRFISLHLYFQTYWSIEYALRFAFSSSHFPPYRRQFLLCNLHRVSYISIHSGAQGMYVLNFTIFLFLPPSVSASDPTLQSSLSLIFLSLHFPATYNNHPDGSYTSRYASPPLPHPVHAIQYILT